MSNRCQLAYRPTWGNVQKPQDSGGLSPEWNVFITRFPSALRDYAEEGDRKMVRVEMVCDFKEIFSRWNKGDQRGILRNSDILLALYKLKTDKSLTVDKGGNKVPSLAQKLLEIDRC